MGNIIKSFIYLDNDKMYSISSQWQDSKPEKQSGTMGAEIHHEPVDDLHAQEHGSFRTKLPYRAKEHPRPCDGLSQLGVPAEAQSGIRHPL